LTGTKQLAVAFYVAAALAGAVVGITVDRYFVRSSFMSQLGDQRAMRDRLADELRLDATQRAALDTILDARNERFEALMEPVKPQLDSVGAAARTQIRQLLTPEQQAIYDKMQREREAARREEKKA